MDRYYTFSRATFHNLEAVYSLSSYLKANRWLLHFYNQENLVFFLAFYFCRFCVVIRLFSSPPQRPMTSDFEGFLYQILSITLFSYLNYIYFTTITKHHARWHRCLRSDGLRIISGFFIYSMDESDMSFKGN